MPAHGKPSEEAPCRSCTSFSEYMKQSKKKYDAELGKSKQTESIKQDLFVMREDCPLDKDRLGSNTWGFLHTMAARFPPRPTRDQQSDMKQFLNLFSQFYPCDHCAEDLRKEMKTSPPKTDSQESLSKWLCDMHNVVNIKLGKPAFDCSKVNERWRDGWLDGSCG